MEVIMDTWKCKCGWNNLGHYCTTCFCDRKLCENKELSKSSNGEDVYGKYYDFLIKGIIQRMRYIPSGEFLMGSPKDESERDNDEDQHKVIFTKGFLLADTACTQELWEIVMGNNPSRYKGKNLPVERVSWNMCIEFLAKINQLLPGLKLRLPTEAEWEYACRAGTTTPFSFGENITTDQVNYNGNNPYNNGKKGEYRGKTVEVKSLPPNSWGLYEMHGNVYEWCQDWFSEKYYNECKLKGTVENPEGPKTGNSRVIRGGCWFRDGSACRSTYRSGINSDGYGNLLGFRLSARSLEVKQAGI